MQQDQSVSEMAEEVLMRQAKSLAQRSGQSLEDARQAVSDTEAGRQLRDLAQGEHRHEKPRSGRGAYFGIGPRRDLCTSLPRKRSRALWPSATTRGLRATWSGWKARKNERTTTRSLRRNSQALGDEPPIAPMRAFWLWEGSASFLCHPPCPVGPPFGLLT